MFSNGLYKVMFEQKIELSMRTTMHVKKGRKRKIKTGAEILRLDICDLFKKIQENYYDLGYWAGGREETGEIQELIK